MTSALLAGCSSASAPAGSVPSPPPRSALLVSADLPGYGLSDPAGPEPADPGESACDRLFDRFSGGGPAGTSVAFEANQSGPFVVETLTRAADGELAAARSELSTCARFRSDDLSVAVTRPPLPPFGDESVALELTATGTESEAFSGYLVVARVGATVCTVVNYGMPGVDEDDAVAVVRKAVAKL